eukprot:356173-Chlamydomonas_euryale.AAC.2
MHSRRKLNVSHQLSPHARGGLGPRRIPACRHTLCAGGLVQRRRRRTPSRHAPCAAERVAKFCQRTVLLNELPILLPED